ncbi:MAG: metal-dependent transcriptional regulator [Flavobacteriales bacterium]|jgi:DtxR family Mn-dependent transcriptional regulator|nr:metal-dependent transcriptional regulator [Flavobacteriales bacterium]MBK7941773.1 metal-dependent transcriptional regulator [Flavobacteriales bacterium]MBK8949780.1 metal-dependent transcriptional regulator [Flavobacteriales bacterium]MBK9700315.1 metal-dependent transcriptional regulator [Flavobacteriales bacterium]
MFSRSEEDHIKAIHGLLQDAGQAFTKDIADRLNTRASSVTDMLKKLAAKGLVKHAPYHGATLTAKGRRHALTLVRKHRLWETFLVQRLGFAWDEVHEVAEQLEHVSSEPLIERLDAYLGHPRFDPHGDPIPDRDGRMPERVTVHLSEAQVGLRHRLVAVKDGSDALLRLLDAKGLAIGRVFTLAARQEFDGSLQLTWRDGVCDLSAQVAAHLLTVPDHA